MSHSPRARAAERAAYAECHRRPRCEATIPGVCTGANEHAHHRRLRSQRGPTTSDNLLAVCNACHTWIHHHRAEAHELGFILHAGDPIIRYGFDD